MSEKFVEHQIRYTWRSIYKMHNEQAIKSGGTLAQAVVLLNLNPNKGTPSTSNGPKMGLESTSLGRTLKSMENNGLISRIPNKKDKRGVFILLTKKVKELRVWYTGVTRSKQTLHLLGTNHQYNFPLGKYYKLYEANYV